ncbi:MAG: hypothetical protein RLZZ301_149 [Bacteroidota bacterium]|jgi:hypothetical protein
MKGLGLSFIFLISTALHAQYGCTDPQAINYNAQAQLNDGSCLYSTTNTTPTLIANLSSNYTETSALVYHHDSLFSINDSGSEPILYSLDPVNGMTQHSWQVQNATNTDWEALASDAQHLYVGDIGNNAGTRQYLCIYTLSWDQLLVQDSIVTAVKRVFYYPDQPDSGLVFNAHPFDAEALVYLNDSLHIFSKNWNNLWTKHYVLPCNWTDTIAAQLRDSLFVDGLITDASSDTLSNQVYLLGYNTTGPNSYKSFMYCLWDFSPFQVFSGNKRRFELGSVLTLSQTEGLCISGHNQGFISGEQISSVITISPKLHHFDCSPYFSAINQNTLHLPYYFDGNWIFPSAGAQILVTNEAGKVCFKGALKTSTYSTELLQTGCYFLEWGGKSFKFLK